MIIKAIQKRDFTNTPGIYALLEKPGVSQVHLLHAPREVHVLLTSYF